MKNNTQPSAKISSYFTNMDFEDCLIDELIHSKRCRDYCKPLLCPVERHLRRHDFKSPGFNELYEAIQICAETTGDIEIIPQELLLRVWCDEARRAEWDFLQNDALRRHETVLEKIQTVFYDMHQPADFGDLLTSRLLPKWFEERAILRVGGQAYRASTFKQLQELVNREHKTVPKPRCENTKLLSEFFTMDGATLQANELIKHNFLCRGAGVIISAPTGVGKSVLTLQMATAWALGRPTLGLEPNGVLRSIILQGENDDNDMFDIVQGMKRGFELNEALQKTAGDNVQVVRETTLTGTAFFSQRLEPALAEFKPDVVLVDPIFSFIGGDASSQEVASEFVRNQLAPLLLKYNCGALLMHHVPRPSRTNNAATWADSDFAYAGHGSADFFNWARGVIALNKTQNPTIFAMLAAKRGQKLGWKDTDGKSTIKKFISHSDGYLFWQDADIVDVAAMQNPEEEINSKDEIGPGEVLKLIPARELDEPIGQNELYEAIQELGLSRRKTHDLVAVMVADQLIFRWEIPRPNAKPKIAYHMAPQPGAARNGHSSPIEN